ncbi:coiled-coil domain-containing protein 122-like isoform X2 [Takifugu flavidus]|uniref:coiled-coil domain-containing protein 122-like isoform X2 n=1 Tax=Takifugu flavidus TaxID=433684 RepID=UPI0005D268B2|nr:coiled-coil domain-containing protein 122-like isoform X2 [Takifugu flavidus]|eukprot:XP_011604598.1 PREDICTED: coiled-coil domain-containing protein 122 isoform X2 [Takifugu rubripes]
MSDYEASENGRSEVPDCSLTKIVEEISQHWCAELENLREKQKTLSSLQATLSEIEKKGAIIEQDLRSEIREILVQEAETEQLEHQKKVLHERCGSISKENEGLKIRIGEEEEAARTMKAQFSSYRKKMGGHRVAVLHASQAGAQQTLKDKRAFVGKLREKREELRQDLENPNGSTVEKAKREINALKVEISVMKKTASEKRKQLLKETETHTQIKKDTEIQHRRFEAIVRRLHLQLSRAQDAHRTSGATTSGQQGAATPKLKRIA